MGASREDVEFAAEDGVVLRAWLYRPEGDGPWPGITMAHGYAATRHHGLDRLGRAFAEAGFAVLLHDHRGFGDSGGTPRQDIDPWRQITDWRRAISFLQDRPEVDEGRVGLWGTSFAGGHAIVLGATDRRIRAVVAQVPTTDGHAVALRRVPPGAVAALEAEFAADDRAQARGAPPVRLAVASADPAARAAYRDAEALAFYGMPVPDGTWTNDVTLRSTRWARMYAPVEWIDRVSPTPLLVVAAKRDTVVGTDQTLKGYERALQPKRLALLEGGHFDPYLGQFPAAAAAATAWFAEHL